MAVWQIVTKRDEFSGTIGEFSSGGLSPLERPEEMTGRGSGGA